MPEFDPRDTSPLAPLNVWHAAVAALRAERSRVLAKYDRKIAALEEAIARLQRGAPKARADSKAEPAKRRKTKRKR